ncbi:hypothetical protein Pmani_024690 [Petrolisthes manimaculis]|uniref:Uncharacterized protein n=1 Tax=Petrolisthes manimaculis TaxID=1843537 RepID=A0AAE1TZT8_9EUCA|nr:hypothetical protein Pmani_024690 [Petrolisthes manimaculis]
MEEASSGRDRDHLGGVSSSASPQQSQSPTNVEEGEWLNSPGRKRKHESPNHSDKGQSWEDMRPAEERQHADPYDIQAGPVYVIRPHKELYHFQAQLPRGFDKILHGLGSEKRQSKKKEIGYAVLQDSLAYQKRCCDKLYDNLDQFKTLHERFWSKPNKAGEKYIKEYIRLVLRPRVAIKMEQFFRSYTVKEIPYVKQCIKDTVAL